MKNNKLKDINPIIVKQSNGQFLVYSKSLNIFGEGKDINEVDQDELTQVFNQWELLSELAGVLGLKVNLNQLKLLMNID